MRPFLFLSGESFITLPLVFSKPKWEHSCTPDYLLFVDGCLRRSKRPREILKGIVHYAHVSDRNIEEANLKTIIDNNIPCWPDPKILLNMIDRHKVLNDCKEFINHSFYQDYSYNGQIDFPFVVKTGNDHRGLGKYLVTKSSEIPKWDGIATIEPYFEGDSVRVLIIGDDVFGFKIENDRSWIKNSPGADIFDYNLSDDLINHAKSVSSKFKLDIAGVDYIVNDNGFHFLEINQYPGISVSDEIAECAKAFLSNKMKYVEDLANYE